MKENHSFDNYLGMLPVSGQPLADGFIFNTMAEPIDSNPLDGGRMHAYHLAPVPARRRRQLLEHSHGQINGGAMDGFARIGAGRWATGRARPALLLLAGQDLHAGQPVVLLGPAQTEPNRRFLWRPRRRG